MKIITNVRSNNLKRLRYTEVVLHLVPFKSEQIEALKKNDSLINDIIHDVLGKSMVSELNSVAGKILLESRIKKRINETLSAKVIKEIFFSTFVIQ